MSASHRPLSKPELLSVLFTFALLATAALLAQDAAKPDTVPVSGPEQFAPMAAAQPQM
jgi:hypothetical protein